MLESKFALQDKQYAWQATLGPKMNTGSLDLQILGLKTPVRPSQVAFRPLQQSGGRQTIQYSRGLRASHADSKRKKAGPIVTQRGQFCAKRSLSGISHWTAQIPAHAPGPEPSTTCVKLAAATSEARRSRTRITRMPESMLQIDERPAQLASRYARQLGQALRGACQFWKRSLNAAESSWGPGGSNRNRARAKVRELRYCPLVLAHVLVSAEAVALRHGHPA
jgi:hypothetical protein